MKKTVLVTVLILVNIVKGWSNMSDDYNNVVNRAKIQLEEKLNSVGATVFFKIQLGVDITAVKSFLNDIEPKVVHLIYKESKNKNEEYLVIFKVNEEVMGVLLNKNLEMITVGYSTNCQFPYLSPAFKFDNAYLQATFGGVPRYIDVHLSKDYLFSPERIFIRTQDAYNKPNWLNYKNDKKFENRRFYKQEVEIIMNPTQRVIGNQ